MVILIKCPPPVLARGIFSSAYPIANEQKKDR